MTAAVIFWGIVAAWVLFELHKAGIKKLDEKYEGRIRALEDAVAEIQDNPHGLDPDTLAKHKENLLNRAVGENMRAAEARQKEAGK